MKDLGSISPIWCTADDGARLAVWDLGGTGAPILALHGNGLHGRLWSPMASHLRERFHLWALDLRGHGLSSLSPQNDYRWTRLADDALLAADALGLTQKSEELTLLGHSCGATAAILAAARRPTAFKALWCYEPILMPQGAPEAIKLSAFLASSARRRRSSFDSLEDARDHLSGRGMFSSWSQEMLEIFLDGGLLAEGDAWRLACTPETEAAVFEQAPFSGAFEALRSPLPPIRLVSGAKHADQLPTDMATVHQQATGSPSVTASLLRHAGHFGPFEDPLWCAQDILKASGQNWLPPI